MTIIEHLPAGRCPTCGRIANSWRPQSIIDAVTRHVEEHGRLPLRNEWVNGTPDHPSVSTVTMIFGGWNQMLTAAGFPRRRYQRDVRWSRDEIAEHMLDWLLTNGRWPKLAEWKHGSKLDGRPCADSVLKAFGTWTAAKQYAGWSPNQPPPRLCAGCGRADLDDLTLGCTVCADRRDRRAKRARLKRGPAAPPPARRDGSRVSRTTSGGATPVNQTGRRKRQLVTDRSDQEGR